MKSRRSKKPTTSRTIGLRLTEEEFEALERIKKEHGIPKNNLAIRILIRQGGGLIETDPELVATWKSISKSMTQSGNLLNQIARAANQGSVIWDKKDDSDLQELRKGCLKLARMLVDFAEGASRRRRSEPILASAIKAFTDG